MNGNPDRNPLVESRPCERSAPGSDLNDLVVTARKGDPDAWNALYERFTPLVDAIGRQYRLSPTDLDDMRQVVWLRLWQNLARLREARALPGWLKTTSRNEALKLIAERRRTEPVDPDVLVNIDGRGPEHGLDHDLLCAERNRAIVDGLAELAPEHRRLLVLLHAEPRARYQEIGRTLGMPPGSIGPTRARCLEKLRKTCIDPVLDVGGKPGTPCRGLSLA